MPACGILLYKHSPFCRQPKKGLFCMELATECNGSLPKSCLASRNQKLYAGRPPGIIPVNLNFPRDAYELLDQLAPTKKSKGHFLSRLLYEYQAQQVERLQWREKLASQVSADMNLSHY